MNKYLVFICFGILLFILWNKIDKFNISSQFDITDLNFDGGISYECPVDIRDCLQCMDDAGRPCVLISFLNLLNIITNGEIDTVFHRNPDFLGMLTNLQMRQPITFYQDTLGNFPSNLLDDFNLDSGEDNVSIIKFKDQTRLYNTRNRLISIDSMLPQNKILKDHIEINKIYIATIYILYYDTYDNGSFIMLSQNRLPSPEKFTEEDFQHTFLLYRTEDTLYLINSAFSELNVNSFTTQINCNVTDDGKDIINDITNYFLFDGRWDSGRSRKVWGYRLLTLYKFKSKTNECAVTVDDDVETTGA